MNPSFSSSYIVERSPLRFGGQQADYQRRTQALINWGARQIKETPKEEKALVSLFFRLLDAFSQERQKIAHEHHTPKAEQFGRRRDLDGKQDFYHTILDDVYVEYNAKILDVLAQHMRGMPIEKKNLSQKSKKIEETYLDLSSSLEIEIFEGEELAQLKWNVPLKPDELPSYMPKELLEKREKEKGLSAAEWQILKQAMKKLKGTDLPLYKRLKMSSFLLTLQKKFPSPTPILQSDKTYRFNGKEGNLKSFFALATARLSVKGKNYATTQFLTWLYRDFATHPIDRMRKYSTVIAIHQDNFLIEDTLQQIALIFAKAVLANPTSSDLNSNTGLLRHYFANCMLFERGSAAIGECFEGSIYGAQDLEVTYNSKKQIDLEALTSPLLSLFMKNYLSMIELRPIVKCS